MDPTILPPSTSKQKGKLCSFVLVRQPVKEKENSEFKPVKNWPSATSLPYGQVGKYIHIYRHRDTYSSKFQRRSLIFIIMGFRTIVFIFIVISTTFRPICLPAFLRYLSNSGTFTELRTTSFIESTSVACSDSVSHNRVQVLNIPVLLLGRSHDSTPIIYIR